MRSPSQGIALAVAMAATLVAVPAASASTIPVGIGAFGGSTLTAFAGLADGSEVNGLIVDGIEFSYSAGNSQLISTAVLASRTTSPRLTLCRSGTILAS